MAESTSAPRRKSQGRRKIDIRLIDDINARTVTFSKRRVGIFKKATELSILCSARIALIIFSIAGRPFSFGHPDVDSVLHSFVNPNTKPEPEPDSGNGLMVLELKLEMDQKRKQLELKKKRSGKLAVALENSRFNISEEGLKESPKPRLSSEDVAVIADMAFSSFRKKGFIDNHWFTGQVQPRLHSFDDLGSSAAATADNMENCTATEMNLKNGGVCQETDPIPSTRRVAKR